MSQQDDIKQSFLQALESEAAAETETGRIVKALSDSGAMTIGSLRNVAGLAVEDFQRAVTTSLRNGLIELTGSSSDDDARVVLTSTGKEIATIA